MSARRISGHEHCCIAVALQTYLLDPEDEDECLQKSIGHDIRWKEGQNVTVKVVQKKQKKKGKVSKLSEV